MYYHLVMDTMCLMIQGPSVLDSRIHCTVSNDKLNDQAQAAAINVKKLSV